MLQSTSCVQNFHIMKDAISKMVKKLSFDKRCEKTAGIFRYFVTFSHKKVIDTGELIEIWNLIMPPSLEVCL